MKRYEHPQVEVFVEYLCEDIVTASYEDDYIDNFDFDLS